MLHRELSIPVSNKIDSEDWKGWSTKEGVLYAQPPNEFLDSLLIVRIHLEDNDCENGALHLIAGSHLSENTSSNAMTCEIKRGAALVMRPRVRHKSPKLKAGQRRVMHIVFGPRLLPE